MKIMLMPIWISLRVTVFTLLLTGLAYPLLVTGLSQLFFPYQANGSLIRNDQGHVVGSELLAQQFRQPAYFQPRPSAAGKEGYEATASGGSNLGPTSRKLRERVKSDLESLKNQNPNGVLPIPVELVTASASGLDPHLSLAGALWQIPRVAQARGIAPHRLDDVVRMHLENSLLFFIGEPRVNVLLLNLAIDRQFGKP